MLTCARLARKQNAQRTAPMTIAAKDGFTQMIDDSNAFFTELARNNTKDWFSPRKEHYTANIKKPAELFAEILAEDFSQISAAAHMPKPAPSELDKRTVGPSWRPVTCADRVASPRVTEIRPLILRSFLERWLR